MYLTIRKGWPMKTDEHLRSHPLRSFSGVTLLLLTACTLQRAPIGDAALVDFAARYTAAWSSQDAASVAAFFADDGSLQINDGDAAVGGEALTALAQSFMTALPDMVLTMDSVRRVGMGAEYFWTLDGTNAGPGGTGNAVHISGYEEWTFSGGGLIERSLGHMDTAEYQRQLEEGVGAALPFAITGAVFVAVQVRDLEATGEWYRSTFDLVEVSRLTADDGSYEILILDGNNITVELLRLRDSAEPPVTPFGLFKVGFHVADIDAAHRRVTATVASTDAEIVVDEALGVRSFVFRDPEGNRLQAFQECGGDCR